MEMHTGLISLDWTALLVLLNILILYIILRRFFWVKIRKFMTDRQNSVKEAFDSAEAQNKRADEKMENYMKRIASVEEESREIIKEARARAQEQARDILEDARRRSGEMMMTAERNIEMEKAKAVEGMRQEIGALAVMAAEKIVEREIRSEGQEAIVDEVIERARSREWQI